MVEISICIPAFNNLDTLKRCLKSIFYQTFSNYEIIITDDSTTDEISAYIQSLSENKIKYYKNEQRLGSPENWNEAIRKSGSQLVKILHHDDWLTDPGSLQVFYDLMKNKDVSMGFVSSRNYGIGNKLISGYNSPKADVIEQIRIKPELLIKENVIGSPSAIIFRKNDLYFDVNTVWLVDVDFYVRLLKENNNIAFSSIDAVSIGNSEYQITKKVENDRSVILYEYFYLLNKYNIRNIYKTEYHKATTRLFNKFNIRSVYDIKKYYLDSLPNDIARFFSLGNKISGILRRQNIRLLKKIKRYFTL
jgi:glycosyltransferase involved in cell wall biosynthesis